MPKPDSYSRAYDFTPLQPANAPVVGARLNAELDRLVTVLGQFGVNLALIQRDDGKLANASVHLDSLSDKVRVMIAGAWLPRGAWVASTDYDVRDIVTFASVAYVAITAHTSGVFATDLGNDLWLPLTTAGADEVQAAIDAANEALVAVDAALTDIESHTATIASLSDSLSALAVQTQIAAATAANLLVAYVEVLSPVPTTTPDAYFVGAGPFDLGDFTPGTAPYANERVVAVRMDLSRGLGGTIDLGDFS